MPCHLKYTIKLSSLWLHAAEPTTHATAVLRRAERVRRATGVGLVILSVFKANEARLMSPSPLRALSTASLSFLLGQTVFRSCLNLLGLTKCSTSTKLRVTSTLPRARFGDVSASAPSSIASPADERFEARFVCSLCVVDSASGGGLLDARAARDLRGAALSLGAAPAIESAWMDAASVAWLETAAAAAALAAAEEASCSWSSSTRLLSASFACVSAFRRLSTASSVSETFALAARASA
mmetsp:Transcript_14956/g.34240  ORF Transcript_14956/g.34240 Transcript_14956/m.34240 type:complete len:239 (+) Transcript_14956:352-1068(+)